MTTHVGDLSDRKLVAQAMKGIDVVIHTAALHAPHVLTYSREDFIETNIKGTLYLLEESVENNVEKFIYTSSTSLYGESMESNNSAVWITEDVPTKPRDIYDITKIAAEELCKDFYNKEDLNSAVLRVSRFWDEPLAHKVFYRMYRGVDVRDVASAHRLAIEVELDEFEIFNISAQPIFQKEDLLDLRKNMKQVLKKRIPTIFAYYKKRNWQMPSFIDRVYAIEKAARMLAYRPQYNIHEILSEY